MNLWQRVKRKRLKLGLSQEELAKILEVSIGMIARGETHPETKPHYLYKKKMEEWLDEDLK